MKHEIPTNPDWVLFDASLKPAPRGVKILCGDSKRGVTVEGIWQSGFDSWGYLPKFPATLKRKKVDGK